jgi:hypothetical protein
VPKRSKREVPAKLLVRSVPAGCGKRPVHVILSADSMSLRLATVHENGLAMISLLFSIAASAIFMASEGSALFAFNKVQQMLRCAQHDRFPFPRSLLEGAAGAARVRKRAVPNQKDYAMLSVRVWPPVSCPGLFFATAAEGSEFRTPSSHSEPFFRSR